MEMKNIGPFWNENIANRALRSGSDSSLLEMSSSNDDVGRSSLAAWKDGHREMAIDCPPTFVGVRKEPPRYPRPLSSVQNSASSSPKGSFAKSDQKIAQSSTSSTGNKQSADYERAERIRQYKLDVQKRREQEERVEMEKEFLRTSLRGSKKLQELEESKAKNGNLMVVEGIVNPNYSMDEEDHGVAVTGAKFGNDYKARQLGVKEVEACIQQTLKYLHHPDDQKEIDVVAQFVRTKEFQTLLQIHNKLVETALSGDRVPSSQDSAVGLRRDVLMELSCGKENAASQELADLLDAPHVKNLLIAFDMAKLLKYELSKSTGGEEDEREYMYERASQYEEDSIKIVRLQKGADPLGATIRNDGQAIIIGRIVHGGTAEKSGLLHEGDEILEINGVDVRGKSINDVCELMSNLTGVLTFLINPSPEHRIVNHQDGVMHVRALFTYDPEEDHYIPCRELGISFLKGDILHVINQEDQYWWQAYREGEDDQTLAGLIPSKAFQKQREILKRMIADESKENAKKERRCRCTRKRQKKKQKLFNLNEEENGNEEILTYEDVALYYPQPNRKRPIVLLGPPHVGCQELRQRLMESDPDRFCPAIPHTTRPIASASVGRETQENDYHFISRQAFEADIAANKFVEFGEFENHFFGTSMDAVRQVVNSGKICVLSFHPQAVYKMKASDLKPFFVFIAPPNIEKLKYVRMQQGAKVTEDELKKTIETARQMEESIGHLFDIIIVNQDLDRAYDELVREINKLELEPQWVPVEWLA